MSSFSRRTMVAAIVAACLSGCGLTPVYGPGGSAEGLHGKIAVDPPRDTFGFDLVDRLENRLGTTDAADYRLTARVFVSETRLGFTTGEVSTRRSVRGRVDFTLRDLGSGGVATSGSVDSFTSYSTTGTPFATQTAQDDARERLMTILADQIVARLLATSGDWRR